VILYSRNEWGALGVEVVPSYAVGIKDSDRCMRLGSAADIALECTGDLGGLEQIMKPDIVREREQIRLSSGSGAICL
jgi:hypothetical protein